MFRWEFATALAGKLLGINPFDQPNVQEAKDRTVAILDGLEGRHCRLRPSRRPRSGRLLGSPRPGTTSRSGLRRPDGGARRRSSDPAAVRDARGRDDAGFRPALPPLDRPVPQGRPATGVFLQVTASRGREDGYRAGRRFRAVRRAQAMGDLESAVARTPRAAVHHGDGLDRVSDWRVSGAGVRAARDHDRERGQPWNSGWSDSGGWARNMASACWRAGTRSSPTRAARTRSARRNARGRRRALARRARREARAAARRLDDGALGRARRGHDRRARRLLSATTSSWTAGTPASRTPCAAPRALADRGIGFVDAGTCGGVWGLKHGYCLMVGGKANAFATVEPRCRRSRRTTATRTSDPPAPATS